MSNYIVVFHNFSNIWNIKQLLEQLEILEGEPSYGLAFLGGPAMLD